MTSLLGPAAFLGLVLGAPHLVPRKALRPVVGIALWSSVLTLRAAASVCGALASVLILPSTAPFQAISGWCVHTGIPFVAGHFGLSGHSLGDAASFLPATVLLVFGSAGAIGIWRAIRTASAWLRRSTVGKGPSKSIIVADREVIVATAGVRKPRVIVSAGALFDLDNAELKAGLAHEWGHVSRGHRVLTVVSAGLLGISRLLPGGKRSFENLQFHLERDADAYAVRRTGDPLALASAICKTAMSGGGGGSLLAISSLAGASTAERLRLLLHRDCPLPQVPNVIAAALGVAATLLSAALVVALPGLLHESLIQAHISLGQLTNCLS